MSNWGDLEVFVEMPLSILSILTIAISYGLIVMILRQQRTKMSGHTKPKVNQVVPTANDKKLQPSAANDKKQQPSAASEKKQQPSAENDNKLQPSAASDKKQQPSAESDKKQQPSANTKTNLAVLQDNDNITDSKINVGTEFNKSIHLNTEVLEVDSNNDLKIVATKNEFIDNISNTNKAFDSSNECQVNEITQELEKLEVNLVNENNRESSSETINTFVEKTSTNSKESDQIQSVSCYQTINKSGLENVSLDSNLIITVSDRVSSSYSPLLVNSTEFLNKSTHCIFDNSKSNLPNQLLEVTDAGQQSLVINNHSFQSLTINDLPSTPTSYLASETTKVSNNANDCSISVVGCSDQELGHISITPQSYLNGETVELITSPSSHNLLPNYSPHNSRRFQSTTKQVQSYTLINNNFRRSFLQKNLNLDKCKSGGVNLHSDKPRHNRNHMLNNTHFLNTSAPFTDTTDTTFSHDNTIHPKQLSSDESPNIDLNHGKNMNIINENQKLSSTRKTNDHSESLLSKLYPQKYLGTNTVFPDGVQNNSDCIHLLNENGIDNVQQCFNNCVESLTSYGEPSADYLSSFGTISEQGIQFKSETEFSHKQSTTSQLVKKEILSTTSQENEQYLMSNSMLTFDQDESNPSKFTNVFETKYNKCSSIDNTEPTQGTRDKGANPINCTNIDNSVPTQETDEKEDNPINNNTVPPLDAPDKGDNPINVTNIDNTVPTQETSEKESNTINCTGIDNTVPTQKTKDKGIVDIVLLKKPDEFKHIEVVEMDGTVHMELMNTPSTAPIEGAVCLMNPRNKEQGKRKVELKAALKVGLLVCCFVCLWMPLPISVCIFRGTSVWTHPMKVDILAICSSLATSTAAVDPILYGLLNRQIRSALHTVILKIKRKILVHFAK